MRKREFNDYSQGNPLVIEIGSRVLATANRESWPLYDRRFAGELAPNTGFTEYGVLVIDVLRAVEAIQGRALQAEEIAFQRMAEEQARRRRAEQRAAQQNAQPSGNRRRRRRRNSAAQ